MEEFDVAVIGAGVSGAAIAWKLAHYDLRTVLLEKCADASFGVSKANSGIVHGGFHHPVTSLKAKLEIRGNRMFPQLQKDLDFPFRRNGILVAAFREEEMQTVRKLYDQGIANGVDNLEMCGRERMKELEPKLNDGVVGGFYAPDGGTVEPYSYVFSLVESARLNGVAWKNDFEVIKAGREENCWHIQAADDREIKARYVVNAAGLFADEVSQIFHAEKFTIRARKGEEYLLDRNSAGRPEHVIFPVPNAHTKGVLVIPTVEGTTMIGPTADWTEDKTDTATSSGHLQKILGLVQGMVDGIKARDLISSFAGLRPVLDTEDFYIAPSQIAPNFIQVAGIQSPGLTASPAIGEYVTGLLQECGLELHEKSDYVAKLPKHRHFRHETEAGIEELRQNDPAWSNIVCRCEKITEAEVIEAVRHGHTTLDGVKFYTRAGMGRCQGGFCTARILQIISRESGIPLEKLTKRGKNSRLLSGRLGELQVKTALGEVDHE